MRLVGARADPYQCDVEAIVLGGAAPQGGDEARRLLIEYHLQEPRTSRIAATSCGHARRGQGPRMDWLGLHHEDTTKLREWWRKRGRMGGWSHLSLCA